MRQPEAVKLFIGNVPRDWSESDLRTLMATYGDIHSLNVLKDKITGQHKGCAFLSYFEKDAAKAAQEELHEKKTLPGSRNPLQVKPADSETKVENRNLFLGMLSRSCDENELRDMFSSFGTIENLTILKNSDGKSKGCGFIKFETRQQAQNAIREMHNSVTMEGCPKSIVVKLADTDKEKINKKRTYEGGDSYNSSNMYYGSSNAQSANLRGGSMNTYGSSNMRGSSAYLPDTSPMASQNAMGQVGVGAANLGSALAPLQQTAISQQLLAQMGLPQLVAAHPSLLASTNPLAASTNPLAANHNLLGVNTNLSAVPGAQGTTMAALVAALASQQQQQLLLQQTQQLQQQQQQLQSVSQTDSYGRSTYNAPQQSATTQVGIAGSFGGSLGTNLSNLQTQLGGGQATGLPNVSALGAGGLNAYANSGAAAGLGGGASYAVVGGPMATGASMGSAGLGDNLYQQAYSGIQQYSSTYPQNSGGFKQQQGPTRGQDSSTRGPDGANLFIYHIPTEYNDNDLMRTFSPYGNVLSAKVFLDKRTGLSKSYGFVNYDNANSAQSAIRALNGFAIGSKRLKVELKRPREHGDKPY